MPQRASSICRELVLTYGLALIFIGLVAWSLLCGVEPVAPAGEEVPVGVLVSLLEGVVPVCLGLIIGLVAEYYGERELRQVAKR